MVDALVDDELDGPTAEFVGAHLRECWECSVMAETARLIKRSLRRTAGREPPSLATARLRHFSQRLLVS